MQECLSMTTETLQEKLAQFDEFFSIEHAFNVNINLNKDVSSLTYQEFLTTIPLPFKMASEVNTLDQASLKPLQVIGGVAGQLVTFLNQQAQKIDLLVGYILSQEDDECHRFTGVKFGGGGLIFGAKDKFEPFDKLEMKVFFLEENTAIFCIGEIIEVSEANNTFHHKVIFHHLREEDREILVRTSLHQQSKQLQSLAKERSNKI